MDLTAPAGRPGLFFESQADLVLHERIRRWSTPFVRLVQGRIAQ
jgi:hypothetical protein